MGWFAASLTTEQRWTHLAARLQAKRYQLQIDSTRECAQEFVGGFENYKLYWDYRFVSLSSNGLRVDAGFFVDYGHGKTRGVDYEIAIIERLESTLDRLWKMGDELCGGA